MLIIFFCLFQEAKIDFEVSASSPIGSDGGSRADEAALPDLFDDGQQQQQHSQAAYGPGSSSNNMPSSSQMAANATNLISSFKGGKKKGFFTYTISELNFIR